MTRKRFVILITFILVIYGMIRCFSYISFSKKAVSVDITNAAYCKDVLEQTSHQATPETASPEEVMDFSNSFLLYNFAEKPIAIFYKLDPVGYVIYDFTNGIVLQYATDTEHPVLVDEKEHYYYQGIHEYYVQIDEGYLNVETGIIKKLNVWDYLFGPDDFYAFPVLNKLKNSCF